MVIQLTNWGAELTVSLTAPYTIVFMTMFGPCMAVAESTGVVRTMQTVCSLAPTPSVFTCVSSASLCQHALTPHTPPSRSPLPLPYPPAGASA